MTDHINHDSIKLTRAVKSLFAMTGDAYESEFGDDGSHKREFCRRIAEHYAGLIGCKVVDVDGNANHQQSSANEVVYGIGIEYSPGEFGMTNGPTPDLKKMLAVEPESDSERIIRFSGDRKSCPITEVAYVAVSGVWQPIIKKRRPIQTANPSATEATALAEEIIELADSEDLPSAAIDFAESVAYKARDILAAVESENRATPGQIEALKNMLDGLERWFE